MSNHNYYLKAMGIDVWLQRRSAHDCEKQLKALAQEVASCTRCALHTTRQHTVFFRGHSTARLMIIGEAPGVHEDQQGLPFVGNAGRLLNHMLNSIGLADDDVYITNVLKCRPPDNRDPNPDEITQCGTYLDQQIKQVQPCLILALGRFAGQFLLNKPLSLQELRNQVHYYHNIPFIVSYHPAYLLRNPQDKKKAYCDLSAVQTTLTELLTSVPPPSVYATHTQIQALND